MTEINKIHNIDCYQAIKEIPDKSINLVLTDPLYEMVMGGGGCFKTRQYLTDIKDTKIHKGFNIDLLDDFKRVCNQTNIILFCSKEQLYNILEWIYKNNLNWNLITWHKLNPTPLINNTYLPDTEYIFHIYEKGLGLNGNYETKKKYYLTKVNKNNFNHPTVKPLEIIRNLITNATNPRDIVLDCFMGSGTTAVACKQLKRDFIGFEINKEYCDIANKRLEQSSLSNLLNYGDELELT